jgi:hypothetical protein
MPDRADVALAILTLVLAVVAGVGRLLLGVLAWGERLLLALQRRRAHIRAPRGRMSACPTRPTHSATWRQRATRSKDSGAKKKCVLTRWLGCATSSPLLGRNRGARRR